MTGRHNAQRLFFSFCLAVVTLTASTVSAQSPTVIVDTGPGVSGGLALIPVQSSNGNFQFLAGRFTLAQAAYIDVVEGWMSVSSPGTMDVVMSADSGGLPGVPVVSRTYQVSPHAASWQKFGGYDTVLPAGTYWLSFQPQTAFGTMQSGAAAPLNAYAVYFKPNGRWVDTRNTTSAGGFGMRISGTLGGSALRASFGTVSRIVRTDHPTLSRRDYRTGSDGVLSARALSGDNFGIQSARGVIDATGMRVGVWSTSDRGLARNITYRTFRNTNAFPVRVSVNAVLHGYAAPAWFHLPYGPQGYGVAIRILRPGPFTTAIGASGQLTVDYLLGQTDMANLTAGTSFQPQVQYMLEDLDRALAGTGATITRVAAYQDYPSVAAKTPINVPLSTPAFDVLPGEDFTILFDAATYSFGRTSGTAHGYGSINLLDTMEAAPVFFTDGAGQPVTGLAAQGPDTPGPGPVPVPAGAADQFVAAAGTTLTAPAPGVLVNDNANGASLMEALLSDAPQHGTLTLEANGAFSYAPDPGFVGSDSFSYRPMANGDAGNEVLVSLTVGAVAALNPANLRVQSIRGDVVTLRWDPPVGASPSAYLLEGGVQPGQTLASATVPANPPVLVVSAAAGRYFVRARSVFGGQASAPSNEITVLVDQPVAPSAPADLAGHADGTQVALSWRNTFAGGAPTGLVLDVTGTAAASVPLGLMDTFVFNGVPGGTYTFSLRATNGSGASGASSPVTLTFPGVCPGAPQAPDFLAYTVGNVLNLLWDPAGTGPATTGFVLNVTGSFSGTVPLTGRSLSTPVPPGTYALSLRATNACGTSAATAAQTVVVP